MRKLNYQEYLNLFKGKEKEAWAKAWEIRNFEINLYWKRATYFWAFIAATFVGYLTLISSNAYNTNIGKSFPQIEFIIVCLGLVLSIAWYLANKASKKWQENWEKHIDLLEKFVTGPLYQTIKHTSNYSVSKLNLLVSFFFILIWIGLTILFFPRNGYVFHPKQGYSIDWLVLISLILTIGINVCMIFFYGRTDFKTKEFSFYNRESIYDNDNGIEYKKSNPFIKIRRILMPNNIHPTYDEIVQAHELFLQNEPRDLFYKLATNLVESAIHETGLFSITEAISVLLQTWNNAHYRYTHFDIQHFNDINQLINNNFNNLQQYRNRDISTLSTADDNFIINIFTSFEHVLGPVGAAKALHLFCPLFFPIWDNKIAKSYDLPLNISGSKADKYLQFANIQKDQAQHLPDNMPDGISKIKAIDEYNFCKFTKELM